MAEDATSVSMSPDSSDTTAPDTTPLNGSACNGQVNPGYEDTEPTAPPPSTPVQNGGGDLKSPIGDPVTEAVNLELVNMSPYSNSIPIKKESTELDMNDPYDEYFVPVNQHKKYIRGEKLYVTQDKRENLAGSKKKCCCGVVTVLVLGAIIAILVGVILTQDAMPESEARNYNKAGFGANLIPTPPPRSTTSPSPQTTEMPQIYLKNVLEGELTIDNMEFTPGLSDKNSSEFKMLATSLEEEIKTALFDHQTLRYGAADITLKVVELRPGSVVVIYRVGWEFKEGIRGAADPINMETIKVKLQQHIRENDGFLYNYRVASHSIKANRIKDTCKIENGGCSNECIYDSSLLKTTCLCPPGYILNNDEKNCIIEPVHIHPATESPVHHHEESFEPSNNKSDEHMHHISSETSTTSTQSPATNLSESVHIPEVNTEINDDHIHTTPPTSSFSDDFIEHEHSTERVKEVDTPFGADSGINFHTNESSTSKFGDESFGLPPATEVSKVIEPEIAPVTETHEEKVDPSINPPMEFLPEYSTYSESMSGESEFTTSPSIIQYSKEPDLLSENKTITTINPILMEGGSAQMNDSDGEISNKTFNKMSESIDESKTVEISFENTTKEINEPKFISNETDSLNEWHKSTEFGSEEINTNYSEVMNHLLSGETHMSQEVLPMQDKLNDTLNSSSLDIITSTTERPLEFNAIETFREAKAANLTNSTLNQSEDSDNSTDLKIIQNITSNNDTEDMVSNSTLSKGLEVKPTSYEVEQFQEVSVPGVIAATEKSEETIGMSTLPSFTNESELMSGEKDDLKNEEIHLMSGESTTTLNTAEEGFTLFVTPPPNIKSISEEGSLIKNVTDDTMTTSIPQVYFKEDKDMNSKIRESLNVDNLDNVSKQSNEKEEIVTEEYMSKNIGGTNTDNIDETEPSLVETATHLDFDLKTINSDLKFETVETQDNETMLQNTTLMHESGEGEMRLEANETMSVNSEMKIGVTERRLKDSETKSENDTVSEMHEIMFEGNDTKSKGSEEKLIPNKNNLHTVNIDELLKESSNSLNSLDDDYDSTVIQEKYKPNKNKLIKNFDVKEIFESYHNKSEKISETTDSKDKMYSNTSESEDPLKTDLSSHTLLSNDGYITESPLFTSKKEGLITTTEKTKAPSEIQDPGKNPLLISEEAYTTESPLFSSKPTELSKITPTTPFIIDLLDDSKQNDSKHESMNSSVLMSSSEPVKIPEMVRPQNEEEQAADVKEVPPKMDEIKDISQSEIYASEVSESAEESTELVTSKDEMAQVKEISSFENETLFMKSSNEKDQNETTAEVVDPVVKLVLNGTTSYSKCASGQVPCKDGSGCIAPNQLCDSVEDCTDGSDEENCQEQKCLQNFQCTDGTCLKRHLVCDDKQHCSDGSDEENCENWKCNFDEVSCHPSSKQCIPALWKCDGVSHCPKNEDEIGCKDSCENHEFLCPEGFCIPMSKKCDGTPDCTKGEDELNCSS